MIPDEPSRPAAIPRHEVYHMVAAELVHEPSSFPQSPFLQEREHRRGMSVAKSLPAESRATDSQLGEDIIARSKRSSITKLNAMHRVQ
ncbi:hypothetical protein EV121DRAFT_288744 [Schizophyllum commune]